MNNIKCVIVQEASVAEVLEWARKGYLYLAWQDEIDNTSVLAMEDIELTDEHADLIGQEVYEFSIDDDTRVSVQLV